MKETHKRKRTKDNVIIFVSTLIFLIITEGFSFVVLFIHLILNIIYIKFFANKWYDLMDSLRNNLVDKI